MKVPISTYRIQFHAGFTFESAAGISRYLKDLGVSHIYASPILQAKKGSMHGYDVVDPLQINPELGGEEKFNRLIEQVRALNMGWLQDIVPNHMAFDSENKMLMDVFEKGEASQFFDYFDINWNHPYLNLKGKALTPFLGDFYGNCLKKGEIVVGIDENGFFIKYYELKLPVLLSSYAGILRGCLDLLEHADNHTTDEADQFNHAIGIFKALNQRDNQAVTVAKAGLWRVFTKDKRVEKTIASFLEKMNNGKTDSLDLLHNLISDQLFRLSFWKVGNDELNYRRFFTVNSLICLRVEEFSVFDFLHKRISELVNNGQIDGIRLDHIDGLDSPLIYMRRLREKTGDRYIVVEKILCKDEHLPENWPVQGTTGYDFLNYVNGVFVDAASERAMERIYISFSGMRFRFESLVVEKKRLFMGKHMAGDIDNLAHLLKNILSGNIYGSDFTMYGLRRALVEIMAHFPVYRTYASELGISESDMFYIKQALDRARRTGQDLLYELDAIEKILSLDSALNINDAEKEKYRHFTKRFQQFTGALMAKGSEDTADYIFNRFISLNEVGGFPEKFGLALGDFHEFNVKRLKDWPYSMSATATHDTKRGEDVRARINVLSEMPEEWKNIAKLSHKQNKKHKSKIGHELAPGKNDEYLIYQTFIGAFPFKPEEAENFKERMKQYIVKAVREAKLHTAWLKPDTQYEEACVKFIDRILDSSSENQFLNNFIPFQRKVAYFGMFNSLSQTLLKLTAPGIPDIYQGNELWDFNLVDPDNRRPVDFEKRKQFLNEIQGKENDLSPLIKELLAHKEDGRIKMFTLYRLLKARNEFSELFQNGEYIPLEVKGALQNHIIAFARRKDNSCCVVIAPRFLSKVVKENELPLGETVWQDTAIILPEGFPSEWRDILTGESQRAEGIIFIGKVLKILPVSLLSLHE
ncbi:MAG: malto-oligosyltrehalose synthase [Candidatus Omnitrophota bacterium]